MERQVLSDKVKLKVLKLNGYKCSYCGTPGSEAEMEIDHIIPVSKGGSNRISNLTTACRRCNQEKSDSLNFIPNRKFRENFAGHIKTNSLVGMFIHTFDNGQIEYQGEIVREVGEFIVIDLFSWVHGFKTGTCLTLKVEEVLTSKNYILYSCSEMAAKNGELILRKEGYWS